MIVNLCDFSFLDWKNFINQVLRHFKDNAVSLGITADKVVTHYADASNGSLLVHCYLTDENNDVLPDFESNNLDNILYAKFCIMLVLYGEADINSEVGYTSLTYRTMRLAAITSQLSKHLYNNGIRGVNINKVVTFHRVYSDLNSSYTDNFYNACKLLGNINLVDFN